MSTICLTYVLINCKLGKEDKAINELRNVPGVVEAYGVYGLYNMVAEVRSNTPEDLKEIISRVRRIENIISTNTLIEVERQA
jgi:DNA-binding Lrp family transcriptional regulator